jgi:hypothetical protein
MSVHVWLCRKTVQAASRIIQDHENTAVRNKGQGGADTEDMRLQVGGGQAYDSLTKLLYSIIYISSGIILFMKPALTDALFIYTYNVCVCVCLTKYYQLDINALI